MTDEQLFQRAKTDPQALTDLYDRYAEKIYKYIAFRIPQKEDAEDIVSATFEKLLAQDSSLRFTESFSAWIHTVAKRKVIDYWRTKKTTFTLEDADGGKNSNIDNTLDDRTQVEKLLSPLQDDERAMLKLHVLDGYKYQEIAQQYGVSTVTVKKRFERLKKKCQTYVSE